MFMGQPRPISRGRGPIAPQFWDPFYLFVTLCRCTINRDIRENILNVLFLSSRYRIHENLEWPVAPLQTECLSAAVGPPVNKELSLSPDLAVGLPHFVLRLSQLHLTAHVRLPLTESCIRHCGPLCGLGEPSHTWCMRRRLRGTVQGGCTYRPA